MPELPEVETTLRGIAPHLAGQTVRDVVIRNARLRWPVPPDLPALLRGQTVRNLQRRAKYLLLGFDHGTLLLHLGMSGSLRILPQHTPAEKHDHFDLLLASGQLLRLPGLLCGIKCDAGLLCQIVQQSAVEQGEVFARPARRHCGGPPSRPFPQRLRARPRRRRPPGPRAERPPSRSGRDP